MLKYGSVPFLSFCLFKAQKQQIKTRRNIWKSKCYPVLHCKKSHHTNYQIKLIMKCGSSYRGLSVGISFSMCKIRMMISTKSYRKFGSFYQKVTTQQYGNSHGIAVISLVRYKRRRTKKLSLKLLCTLAKLKPQTGRACLFILAKITILIGRYILKLSLDLNSHKSKLS